MESDLQHQSLERPTQIGLENTRQHTFRSVGTPGWFDIQTIITVEKTMKTTTIGIKIAV